MRKSDLLARAEKSAAAGDFKTARRLCRAALEQDQADPQALCLAARLALQGGQRKEAVRLARLAVRHAPQDMACHRVLAGALGAAGDADGAIAAAEAALAIDPGDLWFRCELGRYLLSAQRGPEAIATLEAACEAAPRRPEPACYLALALFKLKQVDQALAAARRALDLGEARPGPLSALGKDLADAGALEGARAAFERALAQSPGDLDSRAGLSRVCGQLGDLERARAAARELFRRRPVFVRKGAEGAPRVLVLEYLYAGHFTERRYGANIFRFLNFVSGLEPGRLELHHYHLNRDDPAGDLKRLGRFDAVINNIANGERVAGLGLAPMIRAVIDAAGAPVLNPPEAVLATTRAENYRRLGAAPGFTFPKTLRFEVPEGGAGAAAERILAEVPPPVILRPVTTHAGKGARLAAEAGEVRAALDGFEGMSIYAIAYHECRDGHGVARRYRLIGAGARLIPANMHAAHDWNVHGDERTDGDWQARGLDRAEQAFLDDPASVIGGAPGAVFRELVEATPLDIYGFDFGVTAGGGLVVYEVNAAMSFSTRRLLRRYPYLRPYKAQSQRLIEDHVIAMAEAGKRPSV